MALTEQQIRRLAGRLVIGRLPALTLEQAHRQALSDGTLGGITLFKENAADLEQLARLIGDIIEASCHKPVLAVDQEGGAVQRFDHVLCPLPSPMALAAMENNAQAEAAGLDKVIETITAISSRQLKKLGINMLLAPTLDLQTNAKNPIICTRAYGDRVDRVTAIGARVVAAIEAHGLIAVAKHFPGHGSASEDSHLQLACVDKSEEALMASDLVPFERLAQDLRAILVGHIWLPQLVEAECPATLSPIIVQGLLQQKLGFTGLVVSDDMIMKAITQDMGVGEACVQALLAGVDLLLVCGTIDQSLEAVEAIVAATVSGRVSEDKLRQAASKIDTLITVKPVYLDASNSDDLNNLAKEIEDDRLTSRKVSAQAIAIMQPGEDDRSLPGLKTSKKITVVAPAHPRYPIALAADLFLALGDDVEILELRYALNPDREEQTKLASEIDRDARIIYLTYRSAINEGQKELGLAILAKTKEPVIHAAVDSPYDIEYLEGFEKALSLATFDPSCQAIAALSDILTGVEIASGKCPVAVGRQ